MLSLALCAATTGLEFLQPGLELLDQLGVPGGEVVLLSGIPGEVVELSRGVGSIVWNGKLPEGAPSIIVATGPLVIEVLPVALADREGQADGLVPAFDTAASGVAWGDGVSSSDS